MTASYLEYTNRSEWLKGREKSIGASEVAAAIGVSPWLSPVELWRIKTGRQEARDLSTNSRVAFGTNAEGLLRDLYLLEHPEYKLDYHPYRIYFQGETPFLTATLDGELTRVEDGVEGVYEGKTAECTKKAQWEKWNGKVPDYYYVQLCSQLWCAGKDKRFAVLNAKIRGLNGDSSLRSYEFDREGMEADIKWIVEKATEFWWYVTNDKQPPIKI